MPEQQKSPDLAQTASVAAAIASLTFTRSADYKAIYSNFFRTRVGAGEITVIFSRITHAPSIGVAGNIIEEQAEVTMSWPQLKMLEQVLRGFIDVTEQEVGEISIPTAFKIDLEGQRTVVRSLGLPSRVKE
jgi:hypothetical protein